jgi:hypothetical protein
MLVDSGKIRTERQGLDGVERYRAEKSWLGLGSCAAGEAGKLSKKEFSDLTHPP